MFFRRERAGADFVAVLRDGAGDVGFEVGERFDEAGHGAAGDAEEVVEDEDLAVAIGTGADADRGNRDGICYFFGQAAGDAFKHDGERAGGLGGFGVGHEFGFITLHFVAAKRVDVLGAQAAMGHHGDTGADECGDCFRLLNAAFQFDGLAAGLLQNAAGAFDGAVGAQVKTGEGQIDHDEGMLDGPADHFGMVDHFVERDGERAIVPLDDHRHAVADENSLDAGGINEPSKGEIIGRDHRDFAVGRFEAGEFGNGDAGHVGGGDRGQGNLRRLCESSTSILTVVMRSGNRGTNRCVCPVCVI